MNTLTLSSGNSAPIPSIVISADGTNTFKTSTNTIATWIVVYYHPITSLHDFVAQWMYHYDLSDDFSYGGFNNNPALAYALERLVIRTFPDLLSSEGQQASRQLSSSRPSNATLNSESTKPELVSLNLFQRSKMDSGATRRNQ